MDIINPLLNISIPVLSRWLLLAKLPLFTAHEKTPSANLFWAPNRFPEAAPCIKTQTFVSSAHVEGRHRVRKCNAGATNRMLQCTITTQISGQLCTWQETWRTHTAPYTPPRGTEGSCIAAQAFYSIQLKFGHPYSWAALTHSTAVLSGTASPQHLSTSWGTHSPSSGHKHPWQMLEGEKKRKASLMCTILSAKCCHLQILCSHAGRIWEM